MVIRDRSVLVAAGIASAFYLLLVVPVALWPHASAALAFAWVSLYALLACGLSLEVTELLLSFFWRPSRIPTSQHQLIRGRTAVLMTVCDDADEQALSALLPLSRVGYAVFVLDDSSSPTDLPPRVDNSVSYTRRHNRKNAKAGNLNEWLARFGNAFDNIVILDADSTMAVEAVDALVQATLHPANVDVAIFQSKLAARTSRASTLLSLVLSIGDRPRMRVLERIHVRLGLLLSFGHNQLIRISALRAAEGFSETFTSEDTALSLTLSALGLRTELVDVWSYDTEPSSAQSYIRRTVRWARQTVEIFHGEWSACPLRIKLVLCRHLLSYLLPFIGFVLLLISLACSPTSSDEVLVFSLDALSFKNGYALYGVAMWSTILVVALRFFLQLRLALAEGVGIGPFFLSVVTGPSLQAILTFPVALGMIYSWLGSKTQFTPTNAHVRAAGTWRRGRDTLAACYASGAVGIALMVLAATGPGFLLVGFNTVWVLGFAASPLLVAILTARSNGGRGSLPVSGGNK